MQLNIAGWGPISDDFVKETTSHDVPEHKRFVEMMHDFRKQKRRHPNSKRVCICSTSTAARVHVETAFNLLARHTLKGDNWSVFRRLLLNSEPNNFQS